MGMMRSLLTAGVLLLALACNRVEVVPEVSPAPETSPTPEAPVAGDLSLRLSLDERFQVAREDEGATVLRLPEVPDVELWLAVGRDPVRGAVPAHDSLIKQARSFLEPAWGDLAVSSTGSGDVMLAFAGPREDGNRTLHTWNWMLLRPASRDVLRADVSLRVPGPWAERPEMKGLAEHVADRLSRAEFEPGT